MLAVLSDLLLPVEPVANLSRLGVIGDPSADDTDPRLDGVRKPESLDENDMISANPVAIFIISMAPFLNFSEPVGLKGCEIFHQQKHMGNKNCAFYKSNY